MNIFFLLCMVAQLAGAGEPAADPDAHFERGRRLLESRSAEDARLAIDALHTAADGYRRLGEPRGLAESLYALAVATDFAGDHQTAVELSTKAADAFEQLGDIRGLAAAYDHRGSLLAAQGDFQSAGRYLELALDHRRSVGDAQAVAATLHNLASLRLQTGHGGAALDYFQQASALHQRTGNRRARAATLNNMGLLWIHMGRMEEGRRALERAFDLHHDLGDRRRQAGSLNNLGLLAWTQDRPADARALLERALRHYRQLQDASGLAEVLGNLGLVDIQQAELEDARRRLEAAVHIARRHGLEIIAASHLGSLGSLWLELRRTDQAISTLTEAANRLRALDAPAALSITLFELAQAHLLADDLTAASATIDDAIATVEAMGSKLGGGDLRAYFLAPRRRLYDLRIEISMAEGDPERALESAEQARARGLLDLLRWTGHGSGQVADLAASIPLDQLRALLDDDTELILYHVGERRAWAWSLTVDSLKAVDLGPSSGLESPARDLYRRLGDSRSRSKRGLADRAAQRLAAVALAPLMPLSRKRLVIAPDGALHQVPFAHLPGADGRPLIVEHEVLYLPSLAVLAELRARIAEPRRAETSKQLAVLADPIFSTGDPRLATSSAAPPIRSTGVADQQTGAPVTDLHRLPFSAVEARRIAELFPEAGVRIETGTGASRSLLMDGELSDYRRLHLATHAVIDDRHPERSGLALSSFDHLGRPQEGFLDLEDLFQLRLNAELITLSACRSALGKPLRGEGLLGLTRGFFFAGARRLVVSLWDVDDRAAADLMADFYRGLTVEHLGPAAALTAAQQRMRRDPRWHSPFYWAGFVMIGDWR